MWSRAKPWANSHTLRGKNYIFLATELELTKENAKDEEGIVETYRVPFSEALKMIKDGKITDGQTITSLTLAALELNLLK